MKYWGIITAKLLFGLFILYIFINEDYQLSMVIINLNILFLLLDIYFKNLEE